MIQEELFGGCRFRFKNGKVEHHKVERLPNGAHPEYHRILVQGEARPMSGPDSHCYLFDKKAVLFKKQEIWLKNTAIEVWYDEV